MAVLIMALMVIGIVLCIIEISAPGFGIFGVSGIICIFASTFITWYFFGISIYTILLVQLIITIIASIIIYFVLRRNKSISKLVLKDTVKQQLEKDYTRHLNATAITTTALRPTGDITVGEERFEAMSLDGYLEKGEVVKIVKVEKNKVFVEKQNRGE